MVKAATAKLTSKERCRRAFDKWYVGGIRDWYALAFPEVDADLRDAAAWVAWTQCWQHLESRVTEFIQE